MDRPNEQAGDAAGEAIKDADMDRLTELIALSEKATQWEWIVGKNQIGYCAINATNQGFRGRGLGVTRTNGSPKKYR